MGKLMVKTGGGKTEEYTLKLGDTTIGRSTSCDIVLKNDLSVSGRHAVVKTVGKKSTLEDLDSTNGTYVESRRVTRHELKHGETIVIGKYELRYRDVVDLGTSAFGAARGASSETITAQVQTRVISSQAQLIVVDGKDKGRHIPLVKEETVLENPGKNPARIYRTVNGYVLNAQVGPGEPRLNDRPVPPGGQVLENGDILEVAGTRYQLSV